MEVLCSSIVAQGRETTDAPCSVGVNIAPLDWLELQEGGLDNASFYLLSLRPDLILAADTIYDPVNLESFCQVIKVALSGSRAEEDSSRSSRSSTSKGVGSEPYALVATCVRNEQTHSHFLQAAGE